MVCLTRLVLADLDDTIVLNTFHIPGVRVGNYFLPFWRGSGTTTWKVKRGKSVTVGFFGLLSRNLIPPMFLVQWIKNSVYPIGVCPWFLIELVFIGPKFDWTHRNWHINCNLPQMVKSMKNLIFWNQQKIGFNRNKYKWLNANKTNLNRKKWMSYILA